VPEVFPRPQFRLYIMRASLEQHVAARVNGEMLEFKTA
jgi:hypothetical protein